MFSARVGDRFVSRICPRAIGSSGNIRAPQRAQAEHNFDYWKVGAFHFCVQDPDVEGLDAKIVAAGGKQRMPVREYFPGEKPYRMVYMEDPFGNVLEIFNHSYELTYAAGAYQQWHGQP